MDAELVGGLLDFGGAVVGRRSKHADAVDRRATVSGRDIRLIDITTSLDALCDLLSWLESALFSQRRRGVVSLWGISSSAVRPTLARYAKERHGVLAHGQSRIEWPQHQGCPRSIWRTTAKAVRIFHHCTSEEIEVAFGCARSVHDVLAAAGEHLGLDHPAGERFTTLRLEEVVHRASGAVPAYRDVATFRSVKAVASEMWNRRLWETTSLPPPQQSLKALTQRSDLHVTVSSGTLGAPKVNILEADSFIDRYDAEATMWERVAPSRIAIVGRPLNLFGTTDDAYKVQEGARELRATPGSNPTRVPPARWRRLVADLRRFRPTVLGGDPHYLAKVAKYITGSELSQLRQLIVSNHMSWSFQIAALETAFGIRPRVLYHSGETGMISASCRHGNWHLLECYAHYETLRGGRPTHDGAPGLLIVSLMDGRVRPLLRYPLGDIACLKQSTCPCGRQGRVIRFEGRAAFSFKARNGAWMTPTSVDATLRSVRNVEHLAVRRSRQGLVVEYIGDRTSHVPTAALRNLSGLEVQTRRVSSLPLSSAGGKLSLFSIPLEKQLDPALLLKGSLPSFRIASEPS